MGDEQPRRCEWPGNDPLYVAYHDHEWGTPVHDDRVHFEFLVLEAAQAGLSWSTILRKREAYRVAYCSFDPWRVAAFGEKEIASLLANPAIVRNRLKVRASVENARRFLGIQREFGSFDEYLWRWVSGRPVVGKWSEHGQIPTKTRLSDAVSADLKKRGLSFVGSTIMYAHLQAVGVVNDHVVSCFRYRELVAAGGKIG